jgi:hypothetical protein
MRVFPHIQKKRSEINVNINVYVEIYAPFHHDFASFGAVPTITTSFQVEAMATADFTKSSS